MCQMGSYAYGASMDNSDMDIYGFCIPPKSDLFPYRNRLAGFGTKPNPFSQWTVHHIHDGAQEYDLTIYSIVKFFDLAFNASPNIVDALFVPRKCILHTSPVGNHVRENRKLFLSSKLKPRLLGYAYAQLNKLKNGNTPLVEFINRNGVSLDVFDQTGNLIEEKIRDLPKRDELVELARLHPIKMNEKRRKDIVESGYSLKEAYHVVRLARQCEQVLTEGALDLDRNGPLLRSIRNGDWTLDQLIDWFSDKERELDRLHNSPNLPVPYSPDEDRIYRLLMECIEIQYGSIDRAGREGVPVRNIIDDIQNVLDRYNKE